MEEVMNTKGWLKVAKATIKELEKDNYFCGKEITRLEKELSIAMVQDQIHEDIVKVQLGHAWELAYKVGF